MRVVVVQARTGSTRLPGKILKPLAGRPMLARQLERIRAARADFELVVATTVDAADDAVVELCRAEGVRCFRGHPTDLLDRHVMAARELRADRVVKIPSDCPVIDPDVIETVLAADGDAWDYLGNLHPASWPDGNDVECMAMDALETAWREATRPIHREHTTPFLWDQPERFHVGSVVWDRGIDLSNSHRFTVDYPEDYELVRAFYDELHVEGARPFGVDAILALLAARPALRELNARHAGRTWMTNHLAELATRSV